MAVAFRAAGTVSQVTGGASATPGLPAGFAANDIHVAMILAGGNATVTVPGGWTKKLEIDNSTNHRLTIAWRRAAGADSAPTFSGWSQDAVVRIVGFSGATTSGDPFGDAQHSEGSATTTLSAAAVTPTIANSMLLFVGGTSNLGASALNVSGYSGTNPTFTESTDDAFTGGNVYNLGLCSAYGIKTDTTSSGVRTATITNTADGATGVLLALNPVSGTGITGTGSLSVSLGVTASGSGTKTDAQVSVTETLVNASNVPVASQSNISLAVWYGNNPSGAPGYTASSLSTNGSGVITFQVPKASLSNGDPIFYVLWTGTPATAWTCARVIPTYP